MKTSTKLLGLGALGAALYFFYRAAKENNGESEQSKIEGFSVNINPSKIVDSIMPFIPHIPDQYKHHVANGIKNVIEGYSIQKNK